MKYQDYSPEELAMDDFFMRWVNHPDPETKNFWDSFLANNPEKKIVIEEAIELVKLLNKEGVAFPESDYHEVWDRLQKKQEAKRYLNFNFWYKVAAIFIGLVLAGVGTYYINYYQQKVYYATEYGHKKTFILPDSTEVTLNANSQLSYKKLVSGNVFNSLIENAQEFWLKSKPDKKGLASREVWLEGEAFFQVKKQNIYMPSSKSQKPVKFIVHTENLDVEVLGTKFNVHHRKGPTQVVLKEGKVKLNLKDIGGWNPSLEDLVMEPGQLVEYSKEQKDIVSKKVNPEQYAAWVNNKLVFDGTSIQKIVRVLEENYGFEVQVKGEKLLQKQFKGTIPAEDVEILLIGMSEAFNIRVKKTGRKILIQPKD